MRLTPVNGTGVANGAGALQVRPLSSEKLMKASSESGSCPKQTEPAGSLLGQDTTPGIGAGAVSLVKVTYTRPRLRPVVATAIRGESSRLKRLKPAGAVLRKLTLVVATITALPKVTPPSNERAT